MLDRCRRLQTTYNSRYNALICLMNVTEVTEVKVCRLSAENQRGWFAAEKYQRLDHYHQSAMGLGTSSGDRLETSSNTYINGGSKEIAMGLTASSLGELHQPHLCQDAFVRLAVGHAPRFCHP